MIPPVSQNPPNSLKFSSAIDDLIRSTGPRILVRSKRGKPEEEKERILVGLPEDQFETLTTDRPDKKSYEKRKDYRADKKIWWENVLNAALRPDGESVKKRHVFTKIQLKNLFDENGAVVTKNPGRFETPVELLSRKEGRALEKAVNAETGVLPTLLRFADTDWETRLTELQGENKHLAKHGFLLRGEPDETVSKAEARRLLDDGLLELARRIETLPEDASDKRKEDLQDLQKGWLELAKDLGIGRKERNNMLTEAVAALAKTRADKEEARGIIADAREEAEGITNAAKEEAAQITKAATDEADGIRAQAAAETAAHSFREVQPQDLISQVRALGIPRNTTFSVPGQARGIKAETLLKAIENPASPLALADAVDRLIAVAGPIIEAQAKGGSTLALSAQLLALEAVRGTAQNFREQLSKQSD